MGNVNKIPGEKRNRTGTEMEESGAKVSIFCFFLDTRKTSFEALHCFANDMIRKNGFENLDFLGNLGHSIEKDKTARRYIDKGNRLPLSSVHSFTFEPHIRTQNGKWGFKHENIYYFDDAGKVKEL